MPAMPPAIPVVPDFAVAPQIEPADVAGFAAAGVRTLICNRPDGESGQTPSTALRAAAEAAGMAFRYIPVESGGMTLEDVDAMAAALAETEAPHLAYCRSGTRSVTLWALAEAGRRTPADLIEAASAAGYDLRGMRGVLEARAAARRS